MFVSSGHSVNRRWAEWLPFLHSAWGFCITTLFSTFAGMVVYVLEKITYENFSNLSVVFLIPILYSAIYYGTVLAIYSSIISCFVFDYFFIPPFFTLTQGVDNFIKFCVFLIAAVITSLLAGKVRSYALALKEKERKISLLYELGELLAAASTTRQVVESARQFISDSLHLNIQIIMVEEADRQWPVDLAGDDKAALHHALAHGVATGRFMPLFDMVPATYIPLKTGATLWGVMRVMNLSRKTLETYMDSVAAQLAVGIERMCLYEAKEKVMIEKEREALRSALLSSISHDLKTPLAAIMGAASMLKLRDIQLPQAHYIMLVNTIEDESARLHRFIVNLLEITKLESGNILPSCEPVNLDDIVDATLKRLRVRLEHHVVQLEIPERLPLVNLDSSLMQHVFMNLLDNAVKYSEAGSTIIIRGYIDDGNMVIEVEDEGQGVSATDLEKVFDKFYRVYRQDSQAAGTGLGLAICQSIVNVHEGRIFLQDTTKGRGVKACILFPISRLSRPVMEECA